MTRNRPAERGAARLRLRANRRGGFTLAETIVGLALFAMACTLFALMFTTSNRTFLATLEAEQRANALIGALNSQPVLCQGAFAPVSCAGFTVDSAEVAGIQFTVEGELGEGGTKKLFTGDDPDKYKAVLLTVEPEGGGLVMEKLCAIVPTAP